MKRPPKPLFDGLQQGIGIGLIYVLVDLIWGVKIFVIFGN